MKETKHAPASPGAMMHEVLAAFEAFKAANDQRLSAIETKRADVLLEEKVSRIDEAVSRAQDRLDRVLADSRRPSLAGDAPLARVDERKAAFDRYIKTGETPGLLLEAKGLSEGVATAGGYVAPPELERLILRRLAATSPMREICQVRTIGAGVFRKPVSPTGLAAAWVAETAARPETTAPTLDIIDFPAGELYASPAATQALLDDAYVSIDEWLAEEVQDAFAAQETTAFISGDGVNKPKGLLAYTAAPDASYTWGQMGYLATGVAGGFAAANPTDKLIDLIYATKTQYRQNGRFVMNRRTVSVVRKFKDSQGNYIWNAALQPGQSASLLGYPVTEIEAMPDVAANSLAVAFGDFEKGYLITDRAGVRVLRDPYSAKPHVLFYTTKRVGGGVQNFDAVKLLKFAVS
ncbi:MAG: phage capsid protein [Caulobacter sp. 12-67-6]|nr:MAG: phage capsid protein [Caulobacter sp. 12-67-6]OYX69174.1 MAG: phage capsid protein [Caulobacter sp. 32-67-35]OYX93456.1 MAG: phage capsid protein [Caulobacter sp. 35-67-4]HQR89628.1 phage major capsid protein [Caulobacter sp.]